MAPVYKLTYFDFKAVAEAIRLLLSYGNVDFEDIRISREDWPKHKESTLFPLKQMPVLEIDGKVYHQTNAICRMLARKFGLSGKNEEEDYEIDMAIDTFTDFRLRLVNACYEPDEEYKEKKYKDLFANDIPFFVKKLEADAAANKGHMALGRLTWADFYFAGLIDYMSYIARTDLLKGNPNLQAIKDKVLALPSSKAWAKKSPKTDY